MASRPLTARHGSPRYTRRPINRNWGEKNRGGSPWRGESAPKVVTQASFRITFWGVGGPEPMVASECSRRRLVHLSRGNIGHGATARGCFDAPCGGFWWRNAQLVVPQFCERIPPSNFHTLFVYPQFEIGRSYTSTDECPRLQKGGGVQGGRSLTGGVVKMSVGARIERGAALTEFEVSCHNEAEGTEGIGTFEYPTIIWSELASQVARSRSPPLPNQAVRTPEQGDSGCRLRALFSSQHEPG